MKKRLLLLPFLFFLGSILFDFLNGSDISIKKSIILSVYFSVIIIPFLLFFSESKKNNNH
ncbi:MAG TPA: hypothetical protein DIC46_12115 [Porphyromonadaceae bacterium]|nr:hypothetical protein [Porphyromonadaceae bacterium]